MNELLQLREKWRVKKVGNTILGDVGYHICKLINSILVKAAVFDSFDAQIIVFSQKSVVEVYDYYRISP